MSIAILTPSNDLFGKLRAFAAALYAAHGGWFALDGKPRTEARKLVQLGASYDNYAPALAAELKAIGAQR
jgi:hypothetical protein